jgi:transposase InsO family protein
MCRVLEVARSGFYAWLKREPSARARKEERLRVEVRAIHRSSRGCYGSPRIQSELQARGERVGRKRIARLMRQEGLRGKKRRRFRITTNSADAHPVAPNVLDRKFDVERISGPDRVWAADITYVPTREGWLYLAVVLDLASRLVVGWSMGETLESSLAIDALEMALQRRRPAAGLLHHSDRGVQYASHEYRALLERREEIGDLRVHRGVVQPPAQALQPAVPDAGGIRQAALGSAARCASQSRLSPTNPVSTKPGHCHSGSSLLLCVRQGAPATARTSSWP